MKHLYNLKNRITDIYSRYPNISGYITRFVLSFLAFIMLSSNLGYNAILSNIFVVLLFAAMCSFLPEKLMMLALVAYTSIQIFSLSTGLGIVACILFLIMYLIYYRFDECRGITILIIALLCMLKVPVLVPLVLAVTAPFGTILSGVLGITSYYFLHYMHVNTAVFQGMAEGTEITKMSMVLTGIFEYKEMWYTLICVAIAFTAAYFLKRINLNQSNIMAIAIGAGLFLICILIFNLANSAMTSSKLIWFVVGTVISCLAAMLIAVVVLPLDYGRAELLEFEDEEYKYYVRAVPKTHFSKESVKIKRIYSRKRLDQPRGKESER